MQKFFLIILIYSLHYDRFAIANPSQERVQLSSPYHSVTTHLKFLQYDNFHPDIAAKTLDAMSLSKEDKIQRAIQLKQIYDGSHYYINTALISRDSNYMDSINHLQRYIVAEQFPEIYLIKKGDQWLYARESVDAIPKLFRKVYPFGTDKFVKWAYNLNISKKNTKYLGLYVWQHIAMLIIVIFGFVGYKLLAIIIQHLIRRLLIKKKYQKIADTVITPVAKPLSVCLMIALVSLFIKVIQLPVAFLQYIFFASGLFIPLLVLVIFYRLIDVLAHYLHLAASKTESILDDQLVPLIRKSLKLFIVTAGVLFILQNLDFNITGLLAGISIGGLAFALAAQDAIKNLFGSLMIFIDRPFQVGDWVIAQGVDGTVEEVGFRSTRVRTFHNSVVSIPNGSIANMAVDNMGIRVYRRFKTSIAVTYDTPADLIEVFVQGLRQIVADHPHTRKDYFEIHLNSFGTSSLDILFYIFFHTPDWPSELKARHEVMIAIIRLAEKLSVSFAFPTQTVLIESFSEKKPLASAYDRIKEK